MSTTTLGGKISFRFAYTLPFTFSVMRPLVGMLVRTKYPVILITHRNKAHLSQTGLDTWERRFGHNQCLFAVLPKLMLQ
ncbi:hypothetical protein AOQ72_21260 [Bradyrhizobium yuanmingense]|uniref:Uncharacterized protein n=1 Tax=Bradyrhizobium yuanmingense TaxID=108015 RepID=A0A0R3C8C5_9BRAD|nr:hypothetical protein AOQ72_21260 [Bradyrhizobium yuanmingense]